MSNMLSQRKQIGLRDSWRAKNSILYRGGKHTSVSILHSSKEGSKGEGEETDHFIVPSITDAPGPSLDVEYTHYVGVSGLPLNSNVYDPQKQITVALGNLACTPLSKNPPVWRGDEQGDPTRRLLEEDDLGLYSPSLLSSETMSPAISIYQAIDLNLNGVLSKYRADCTRSQEKLDGIVAETEIDLYLSDLPKLVIHVCCNVPFYSSPHREKKDIVGHVVAQFFRAPRTMSLADEWSRLIRCVRIQEHYPWYLPIPNGNNAPPSSDQMLRLGVTTEQTNAYPSGSFLKSDNTDTNIDDSSSSSSSSDFTVSDTEEEDYSLGDDIVSYDQGPVDDHSATCPEIESTASNNNDRDSSSSSMAISKAKDHESRCPGPATSDPSAQRTPTRTTKPKPKVTKPRLTRATKTRRTRTTNPLTNGTTHPAKPGKKRFRCTYSDCTKEYSTKYNMEVHKNKHDKLKFPCEVCGEKFAAYNILYRHYNTQHKGHLWICFPCGTHRSRKPSAKDLQELPSCTAPHSGGVHDFQLLPGLLPLS